MVLVAFHVVKHEYVPGSGGESLDRCFEVHSDLRAPLVRRSALSIPLLGCGALAVYGEAPAMPEDHADRYAVEPGSECRIAAELRDLLPRPNEGVLRQLVGVIGTRHPSRQSVYPGHVSPVQSLERSGISLRGQGGIVEIQIRVRDQRGFDQLRSLSWRFLLSHVKTVLIREWLEDALPLSLPSSDSDLKIAVSRVVRTTR